MKKSIFFYLIPTIVFTAYNVSAWQEPVARLDDRLGKARTLELRRKIEHDDAVKRIAPSESDRNAYKAFLKQSKTGITRLVFPVPCSLSLDDQRNSRGKFANECPTQYLPGNGSNFSFRKHDYVSPEQADITIKNKIIYSMGTLSQGIMVKLGDVQIDGISLQSEGIRFLTDFVPAKTASEADNKIDLFKKGLQNGEHLYASGFKIDENCTFALRVVAYRTNTPRPLSSFAITNGILELNPFYGADERKDIIVGFRIIKIDTDGSVTLIWKELQRQDSPDLKIENK